MEDHLDSEEREFEEELAITLSKFSEMQASDKVYFFDVDDFENLFDHFIESGEFNQAAKVIELSNKQHPFAASLAIRKAQLFIVKGQLNDSLTLLNSVEKIEPFNVDLLLLKATVYSQMHQNEKAILYYSKALDNQATNELEIKLDMAMEYQELQQFDRSILLLAEILDHDPENEIALHEIGHCYEMIGQIKDGVEFFDTFLDEHPFSATAWFNQGDLYTRLDKPEEAINSYDFAISIKEDFAHAYFNKASVYANEGDFKNALDSYIECSKYEGLNPLTFCFIGECFEKLEDFKMALHYYDKVIEVDDNWGDAYIGKAAVYSLMNEDKKALPNIIKAIELMPDSPEYLNFYAKLCVRLEMHDELIESFEKLLEIDSENIEVWMDYAHYFDENDEVDNAIEIMMEGLSFHGHLAAYNYRMAALLLKGGKESEALIFLGEALLEDYENHHLFFDYFKEAENNTNVNQLIQIFKS
jgi:tetratricopeptide (TPR) repeat protein